MTSIDTEPRLARLDSLTGLRFFAAFVVLLRHTVPEIFPLPGLSELSAIGPIGVGFFFVLSGFILTWNWNPATGRGVFYGRRAARILPLHALTTVVAAALLIMADTPLWASTILSLFLLQAWFTEGYRLGGNSPSWSLSVEAFFMSCSPL
ncbi:MULTISPECIES: acyltransferase family protein [Micrococcaceae]|uniref:acyltransferase family protein n=1 Tax=Micrococcaceae TaxID=1268 RepID=UPI001AE7BF14